MKTALALSMSLLAAAVLGPIQARTAGARATARAAGLASPQSGVSRAATGDGLTILNRSCTSCHDRSQAIQTRPAAEWPSILDRMRENGANISDSEAKILLAYLTKNYSSRK